MTPCHCRRWTLNWACMWTVNPETKTLLSVTLERGGCEVWERRAAAFVFLNDSSRRRPKKCALTSCASFCPPAAAPVLCWVMVCPATASRPTQTQGHTHHDTVESVWLGSRSTCWGGAQGRRREGGRASSSSCSSSFDTVPKTWLMSLSLALPFFFCSSFFFHLPVRQQPISWPSLSSPHHPPSVPVRSLPPLSTSVQSLLPLRRNKAEFRVLRRSIQATAHRQTWRLWWLLFFYFFEEKTKYLRPLLRRRARLRRARCASRGARGATRCVVSPGGLF